MIMAFQSENLDFLLLFHAMWASIGRRRCLLVGASLVLGKMLMPLALLV